MVPRMKYHLYKLKREFPLTPAAAAETKNKLSEPLRILTEAGNHIETIMSNHQHPSADGDGEENEIVPMEVIRGDWLKVRTARENQLLSLNDDQLKYIAIFCAPEQVRSHSNTPPSSRNDYQAIIMGVLDYSLSASIDVEKSKEKRFKNLDNLKNCLDFINQVTATATSATIEGSSTRRDTPLPEAPTALTDTATSNLEDHYDMDNMDLFPCIALEDCIIPSETGGQNIPTLLPRSDTAFNAATASGNNPTIQEKEKSSDPNNTGTSTITIHATTATTPSSSASLGASSNHNFISQSQPAVSSSSSTPITAPNGVNSSTRDKISSTFQPANFMPMLQKTAVTTGTALNPCMTSSKNNPKTSLSSESSAVALSATASSTVATSTTGINHHITYSLSSNTDGNTIVNVANHTGDNSIDHPVTSGTSSAINGIFHDALNNKKSEKYPGNKKSTSLKEMNAMSDNDQGNNSNDHNAEDGPILPLVFDSDEHISFLYNFLPGHKVNNNLCTLDVGAAVEPYAASLYTRRACRIQYPVPTLLSSSMMHKNGTIHVRFNRWEPFYKCQHDIVNFVRDKTTKQVVKVQYRDSMGVEQFPIIVTSSVVNCTPLDGRGRPTTGVIEAKVKPMACLEVYFQFPAEIASLVDSWGFESLGKPESDTNRLICRMLPLDGKAMKTDFADTHLWPKGTYIEVNGKPVLLHQRRQQSHDPTQWKGMCKQLDLTPYVTIPIGMNRIKLVAHENACYALQICIAEQRTPLTVFNEVLRSIPVIPIAASLERGKQYVNNQTVCLEHDNIAVSRGTNKQEGGAPGQAKVTEDSYHLTFKLVCPISMTVMNEPVRGQQCQHFQCFDLFNFIETNSFPSGRRWKCPCCDSFVSLDSLELCGWFKEILKLHGSMVSADGIDSVKMFHNGQWELVSSSSANSNKRKADILPQQQMKRNKVALEVIEIDID